MIAERREPELSKQIARGLMQPCDVLRRPPKTEAVRLPRLHREGNISFGGEARKNAGNLKRARESQPCALRCGKVSDVAPCKTDRPGIGSKLAGELAQQRCLARTVWTDQRVRFADWDSERDIVSCDQRAEGFVQPLDFQQAFAHGIGSGPCGSA